MGWGGKRPGSGRKPNPAKGLKAGSARRLLAAVDYESELLDIYGKLPPTTTLASHQQPTRFCRYSATTDIEEKRQSGHTQILVRTGINGPSS